MGESGERGHRCRWRAGRIEHSGRRPRGRDLHVDKQMTELTFRGAGQIWVSGRYIRGTWPFIVLRISDDSVSIDIWPSSLAKILTAGVPAVGYSVLLTDLRKVVAARTSVVFVGVDRRP